jgi:uncharacterized protein (TIGR03435 family)
VASVKPNKSASSGGGIGRRPGGRFNVTNQPPLRLIAFAYQIEPFQIDGGPEWIGSDRFDVVAKAEGDPPVGPMFGPPDQMWLMLRTLLADRFKLATHWETRDMPIYALVLARSDGRLGPQLRSSTVDCVDAPPAAQATDTRPRCRNGGGPWFISWDNFPLSQFAIFLTRHVQRVVVDRTGLSGNVDVDLTWTPDQIPQTPEQGFPPIDPNGPSIFTALQEQLGLKLESTRGPVNVLVIDRIEQPTED